MATYTKSLASDFSGNLNETQLHFTIVDNTTITTALTGINRTGDVVKIEFAATLPGAEETELNNIISSHSPNIEDELQEIIVLNPRKSEYQSTTWERLASFRYRGSRKMGDLKDIIIMGYKQSGVTNYQIRVYDVTNNNIIGSITGTNDSLDTLEILTLNNIPSKAAKIEIQGKRVGGQGSQKRYYVDTVQIYI